MPTMFCPGCGKGLSTEEKATGYCPSCGKPLPGSTATAAVLPLPRPASRAPSQPAHFEEEEPGVSRSVLGWGTVRAGLGQTVVGAIICSLSLLVLYVVRMTAVEGQGTSALPVIVLWFCAGSAAVAAVVMLAGVFLGCAAPAESGARAWAFCASALLILVFILGGVFTLGRRQLEERQAAIEDRAIFVDARPTPVASSWTADEVRMVAYFAGAASVLTQFCYLLFLRAVASFFQRGALALGIVCYLVFNLLFLAGFVLMATGTVDPDYLPQGTGLLSLFIAIAVALGVWGVVLIGQARGAVTRGILQS